MQHLSQSSRRHEAISSDFSGCQDLVRFFALRRIKPHAPPLVRAPSIHLSFNLATVLPRRSTYRVSYATKGTKTPDGWLTSFTAWTTRVSNPVCSPRFRTSASVLSQEAAFATGIPPHIYAFHRYTWNSTSLSHTLAAQYRMQFPG